MGLKFTSNISILHFRAFKPFVCTYLYSRYNCYGNTNNYPDIHFGSVSSSIISVIIGQVLICNTIIQVFKSCNHAAHKRLATTWNTAFTCTQTVWWFKKHKEFQQAQYKVWPFLVTLHLL